MVEQTYTNFAFSRITLHANTFFPPFHVQRKTQKVSFSCFFFAARKFEIFQLLGAQLFRFWRQIDRQISLWKRYTKCVGATSCRSDLRGRSRDDLSRRQVTSGIGANSCLWQTRRRKVTYVTRTSPVEFHL